MADKVVHPSTYDVIELVGTSSTSWEDAANNVIKEDQNIYASCV